MFLTSSLKTILVQITDLYTFKSKPYARTTAVGFGYNWKKLNFKSHDGKEIAHS